MIARITAMLALFVAFGVGMAVQDASNCFMLLPFMLLCAWLAASGRLLKLPLRDPFLLGLLVLWLLWGVSALRSEFPFNSKVTWLVMSTLPLSYMVWRGADFQEKHLKIILGFFLAAGVIFGIGGIIEVTLVPNPVWKNRAAFPFLDPNMLGVFLSLSLLPVIPQLFRSELKLWLRLALLVCVAAMATGLIFTQSRSAAFGTLGGIFLIALLSWRSFPRTRTAFAALGTALVATLGLLISTGFIARFTELFTSGGDENVNSRLAIWRTAFDMSMQHPLGGLGFGTFNMYYPLYRPAADNNSAGWWVHMDPLQWAVEAGWPAAFCFYAIVCWIVFKVWQSRKNSPLSALQIGCAAALFSLFLNAHSAYPLHVIPFMIMATGMLTILLPPPAPVSSPKIAYLFGGPVLIATLILLSVSLSTGATLAMWNAVNTAEKLQDRERYQAAVAQCVQRGDPTFAFCKLRVIESLLSADGAPSDKIPGLIEEARKYNRLLPLPDYYLAIYYRKTSPDRPDLEIEALKQSLLKNPTYWAARKLLAKALKKQGRFKDTLDVLEAGVNYPIPNSEVKPYVAELKSLRETVYGSK